MPTQDFLDRLPRYLTLRELRVLIAVSERGSFRNAARALHITQPAVTGSVAALEGVLGVRMFERRRDGVAPTLHGEAFIRRARAIFGELTLAAEEMDIISSGSMGALHLGTVPMPASGILPAALGRVLDASPGAFISVIEGTESVLIDALKSRRIDFFISRLPEHADDPAVSYRTLFEDHLCVIASHAHPLATRRRLRWTEIQGERWVLPPAGSFFHAHIQRVLHKRGVELPRHTVETASVPTMYGLIASSGFLSFATATQFSFTPLKPLISRLNVDLADITAPIGVVTLAGRELGPIGVRILDSIRELAIDETGVGDQASRRSKNGSALASR